MRFNSVKGGDYSSGARAVNRNSDAAFDASRKSSFDFTGVSNAAIRARSIERQAAKKAEALKDRTQIKADTLVEGTQLKADTEKKVADIKRPAKRMAGVVAGLGALSTGVINMKEAREAKAERAELKLERDAIDAKQDLRDTEQQKRIDAMLAKLNDMGSGDSGSSNPKPSTPAPSGAGSTKVTPVKPTTAKGFRAEVYNYLTGSKGLSKNKALGLMANIDRESSFRVNPAGGDGGNSFGMFQWNNTYGRSDIMMKNVADWQTNWKGQIDHALSGNQLPEYNKVTTDFKNTNFESPQQAADYWMKHWERPADQELDSKKHTEFLSGYNF